MSQVVSNQSRQEEAVAIVQDIAERYGYQLDGLWGWTRVYDDPNSFKGFTRLYFYLPPPFIAVSFHDPFRFKGRSAPHAIPILSENGPHELDEVLRAVESYYQQLR